MNIAILRYSCIHAPIAIAPTFPAIPFHSRVAYGKAMHVDGNGKGRSWGIVRCRCAFPQLSTGSWESCTTAVQWAIQENSDENHCTLPIVFLRHSNNQEISSCWGIPGFRSRFRQVLKGRSLKAFACPELGLCTLTGTGILYLLGHISKVRDPLRIAVSCISIEYITYCTSRHEIFRSGFSDEAGDVFGDNRQFAQLQHRSMCAT
jgi:hypothetical protein